MDSPLMKAIVKEKRNPNGSAKLLPPASFFLKEGKIVATQNEGLVYLKSKGDNTWIVKKRDCVRCSDYEYEVGVRLKHPNVAQTLMYIETAEYRYFVQEYFKGRTVGDFLESMQVSRDDKNALMLHIFHIIADLQHHFQFTHYDLHTDNILMNVLEKEETFTYYWQGTSKKIKSRFDIRLIDFGYAHVQDLSERWLEESVAAIQIGAVSSAFDDLFDYAVLIASYEQHLDTFSSSINRMLEKNKFYMYRGAWIKPNNCYFGRELPRFPTLRSIQNTDYLFYNSVLEPTSTRSLEEQVMVCVNSDESKLTIVELSKIIHQKKLETMSKRPIATNVIVNAFSASIQDPTLVGWVPFKQMIHSSKDRENTTIRLTEKLLYQLENLKEKDQVHLELSPGNILVDPHTENIILLGGILSNDLTLYSLNDTLHSLKHYCPAYIPLWVAAIFDPVAQLIQKYSPLIQFYLPNTDVKTYLTKVTSDIGFQSEKDYFQKVIHPNRFKIDLYSVFDMINDIQQEYQFKNVKLDTIINQVLRIDPRRAIDTELVLDQW